MNLCTLAETDNSFTLEDSSNGFGRAIKLTDAEGFVYNCTGQVNRIGVDVDPETGLTVAGLKIAVTVRYSAVGADVRQGWICETTDITGARVIGRCTDIMIDKALGRITFFLRKGA